MSLSEKSFVTFTGRKSQNLTFLSCYVYCFETSTGGNRAMHDPAERYLLYTGASYVHPKDL